MTAWFLKFFLFLLAPDKSLEARKKYHYFSYPFFKVGYFSCVNTAYQHQAGLRPGPGVVLGLSGCAVVWAWFNFCCYASHTFTPPLPLYLLTREHYGRGLALYSLRALVALWRAYGSALLIPT